MEITLPSPNPILCQLPILSSPHFHLNLADSSAHHKTKEFGKGFNSAAHANLVQWPTLYARGKNPDASLRHKGAMFIDLHVLALGFSKEECFHGREKRIVPPWLLSIKPIKDCR